MSALVTFIVAWLYVDGALISALWLRGRFPLAISFGYALTWPVGMPLALLSLWAFG